MMTDVRHEVQALRRISITEAEGETVIVIAPLRPVAILMFAAALVGVMAFFGIDAYGRFRPSDMFGQQTFMVFWLCCWLLGLSGFAFFLFWMAFGTEVITVSRGVLKLSKALLFLSHSKKYSSVFITNLRWEVIPLDDDKNRSQIAFDYGVKKINFANWCSQDEGQSIIAKLTDSLRLHRLQEDRSEAA